MRKLSIATTIMGFLAGIGLTVYVILERWPGFEEISSNSALTDAVVTASEHHYIWSGAVFVLWLIGYILSFDSRIKGRPWALNIVTLAGVVCLPALASREALSGYAFIEQDTPVLDQLMIILFISFVILSMILLMLFELINRKLWKSLAFTFDQKEMSGAALFANRLSLLFEPGQVSMLRSVTLARFRRGVRGDVVETLKQLHEAGKKDPDILEALCKSCSEEKDSEGFLKYLKELYEIVDDNEIRDALVQELYDQKKFEEAYKVSKEGPEPEDVESLGRYAEIVLHLGHTQEVVDIAIKIAEEEGIPFRGSQRLLREVLNKDTGNTRVLNELARQADRMALKDQRIKWLEKSLEADPEQKKVRLELIQIYRQLEQTQRLEQLLDEVIEENPDDIELNVEYALVLRRNAKDTRALAILDKINKRDESPAAAYLLEAEIHFEQEQWEEAKSILEKGFKHLPSAEERHQMERLLNKIEKAILTDEVAEIFEGARNEPENPDLQIAALTRLVEGHHTDKILTLTDDILERHPGLKHDVIEILRKYCDAPEAPFSVMDFLSDLLVSERQFDDALEVISLLVDRSLDKVSTARDHTQKILRQSPHHLPSLKFLGDTYHYHGRFSDMIHSYSLYLSNGGEETEDIQRAMVTAYLTVNDYKSAQKYVKKLLSENPKQPDLLKKVIVAAIEADEAEDAAEFLKSLKLTAPRDEEIDRLNKLVDQALGERRFNFLKQEHDAGKGSAESLEQLGDLATEMENYNDAITYYQRASRDKSDAIMARRALAKLARAYMQKRLDDLCVETLKGININLETDPPEEVSIIMDILYEIGGLFAEVKMYDRAERVYKQICKIDAGYKDVLKKVEGLRR